MPLDGGSVLAGKFCVLRVVDFDTLTFRDLLTPPPGPGISTNESRYYCLDCILSLVSSTAGERESAAQARGLVSTPCIASAATAAADCTTGVEAAGRSDALRLQTWRRTAVNYSGFSSRCEAGAEQRRHAPARLRCTAGADGGNRRPADELHSPYTVVSERRVLCCRSETVSSCESSRGQSSGSSRFPDSSVTLVEGPPPAAREGRISVREERMRWRKKTRKKDVLNAASGMYHFTKASMPVGSGSIDSSTAGHRDPPRSATCPFCHCADMRETGAGPEAPVTRSLPSALNHHRESGGSAGLGHQCSCLDEGFDQHVRLDRKYQAMSARGRVITFYVAKTDYSNSQEHSSFLAAATHRLGLLKSQFQGDLSHTAAGRGVCSNRSETEQRPRCQKGPSSLSRPARSCSEKVGLQLQPPSSAKGRTESLAVAWLARAYEELVEAFFLCLLPALAARPTFLVPRFPARPVSPRRRSRGQLPQGETGQALVCSSWTNGDGTAVGGSIREGNVISPARIRGVSRVGSSDSNPRDPRRDRLNSASSPRSATPGAENQAFPRGTLRFLGGARFRGQGKAVASRGAATDPFSEPPVHFAPKGGSRKLHTRVTWQPLAQSHTNFSSQSQWDAGREPDFAVVFKRSKTESGRKPPSLFSLCVASLNQMFPALILPLFDYQQESLNGRLLCSLITWSRVFAPPQVVLTFFVVASSWGPDSAGPPSARHSDWQGSSQAYEAPRSPCETTAQESTHAGLQGKESGREGRTPADETAAGGVANTVSSDGGRGSTNCFSDEAAVRMSAGYYFRQRYPFIDMLLHRVYMGEDLFPSIPYVSAGVIEAIFCSRSLNRIDTQHHLISLILSWQFIQRAKGQVCCTSACFTPGTPPAIETDTAGALGAELGGEQSLHNPGSCHCSGHSEDVLSALQEEHCSAKPANCSAAGRSPTTHTSSATTCPMGAAEDAAGSMLSANFTLGRSVANSARTATHERPQNQLGGSIPGIHSHHKTRGTPPGRHLHSLPTCAEGCKRCGLCSVGALCEQVLVNAAPWLQLASQSHMSALSSWPALPCTSPQPSEAYWLQLHSLLRWHEEEEAAAHRHPAKTQASTACSHQRHRYATELCEGVKRRQTPVEAAAEADFDEFRQQRGWRLRRGPRYIANLGGNPCIYDPEAPLATYFEPGEVLVWLHKRWRLVFIRRKRLPSKKTARGSQDHLLTCGDVSSTSRAEEVEDHSQAERSLNDVSPLHGQGERPPEGSSTGAVLTVNGMPAGPATLSGPTSVTGNRGDASRSSELIQRQDCFLQGVQGDFSQGQTSRHHGFPPAGSEILSSEGPASLADHGTRTDSDDASRREAIVRDQRATAPYAASVDLDELSHISLTDLPDPDHLDLVVHPAEAAQKKKFPRRRFVNKIMYASDRRWLEVLTNGPQYCRPEQQPHGGELYFRHARDAECVALHVAGRLSLFSMEELPQTHRALEGLVSHVLYRTRTAAVFSNLGQQQRQLMRQQAHGDGVVQSSIAAATRDHTGPASPSTPGPCARVANTFPVCCCNAVSHEQQCHAPLGTHQHEHSRALHPSGCGFTTLRPSPVQVPQLEAGRVSPPHLRLNPSRGLGHSQGERAGLIVTDLSLEDHCLVSGQESCTIFREKSRFTSVPRVPGDSPTRARKESMERLTTECRTATGRESGVLGEQRHASQVRHTDKGMIEEGPSTFYAPLMELFDFGNSPDGSLTASDKPDSSAPYIVPLGPFHSDVSEGQLSGRSQKRDSQRSTQNWQKVTLPVDRGREGWISENASLTALLRWKSSLITIWHRHVLSRLCPPLRCLVACTGGRTVPGGDSRPENGSKQESANLAGPECPCGCVEASRLLMRLRCSAAPPV